MNSNVLTIEMQKKHTKKMSEQQLAEAIKSSDSAAFKLLYHKYYEPLYRYIFYRLHSKELTKDLLQDVFTRLWLNRKKFDSSKSLKAYIYSITSNLVIDYYRKRSSRIKYRNESFRIKVFTADDSPEEKISIQNAVSKLKDKVKDVFILNRYEGFTYKEIADIQDISVKTVEKRMSKALQSLRDYLKEKI
ncbi:MAG: sigma-70 family RNA polymerase sigma factor [bacterium]